MSETNVYNCPMNEFLIHYCVMYILAILTEGGKGMGPCRRCFSGQAAYEEDIERHHSVAENRGK